MRIHIFGEWRVIYVAKLRSAVYVLHAFQKKSRKTSRYDIDLARQRYRQIGGNLWARPLLILLETCSIDLGYSPDEAAILQMRADLMADLRKLIKARRLTQAKAAEISVLVNRGFPTWSEANGKGLVSKCLFTLATRAGMRVTLKKAA